MWIGEAIAANIGLLPLTISIPQVSSQARRYYSAKDLLLPFTSDSFMREDSECFFLYHNVAVSELSLVLLIKIHFLANNGNLSHSLNCKWVRVTSLEGKPKTEVVWVYLDSYHKRCHSELEILWPKTFKLIYLARSKDYRFQCFNGTYYKEVRAWWSMLFHTVSLTQTQFHIPQQHSVFQEYRRWIIIAQTWSWLGHRYTSILFDKDCHLIINPVVMY